MPRRSTPRCCSPRGAASRPRRWTYFSWGLENATARGEGRGIGGWGYATAVLYNGLGRYDAALASAQRACEYDDLGLFGFALVELVEAGARSGAHEEAAAALRRLEERTDAAGTDWALGVQARSRALLSDGQAAESLYREAIERLERSRIAVHLARAHLVYGEWLRRENRRVDAREHLRAAHEMFSACRGRGVRRARPARAPGHRRDRARAHRRDARACSHPRRPRSPASPETVSPTPRSARSCSSARERCSTTCARSSRSSTSPRATSSADFLRVASALRSRRRS